MNLTEYERQAHPIARIGQGDPDDINTLLEDWMSEHCGLTTDNGGDFDPTRPGKLVYLIYDASGTEYEILLEGQLVGDELVISSIRRP